MSKEETKKTYRDSIIKMVENIDNLKFLISIYSFIWVKFLKVDEKRQRNEQ